MSIHTRIASKTTGGPIPFKDVTFIIPIMIDSHDRECNVKILCDHLRANLDTNVIIYEVGTVSKLLNTLDSDITHIFEESISSVFHKTRYFNHMLSKVLTPIAVGYDVDVLLKMNTYVQARDLIRSGKSLVYPFGYGNFQHMISSIGRDKLVHGSTIEDLTDSSDFIQRNHSSEYGHCHFFDVQAFKSIGWYNENFISYGPEDREIHHRFNLLTNGNVSHMNGHYVYHVEHCRGPNSWFTNPYYSHNEALWRSLQAMSSIQLKAYYDEQTYIHKYT
jgi:hypothetical protein